MVRVAPSSPPVSAEEALVEIDRLLDELLRLAHSATEPKGFHGEVLSRAVRSLAAVAGAFWVPDVAEGLAVDCSVDSSGSTLIERLRKSSAHRELVEATFREGKPRLVLPGETLSGQPVPSNPTDCLLLLCPIVVDSASAGGGLIEILQRRGISPAAEQNYLQLLAAFADVVLDFHRRRQLELWRERAAWSREIEQFSTEVHGSLEIDRTAAAVANEGRRLIQCDRVTVAELRRNECRVLAVSGQAEVDRRATMVQQLEDLIRAVAAAGRPLWYGAESRALAPQIAAPLEAYLDTAHPRILAVIPLAAQERSAEGLGPFAALLVENFEAGAFGESIRERIDIVSRVGGQALQNALELDRVPLSPVWRLCRRAAQSPAGWHLPRALVVAGLVVLAGLALVLFPADFEVAGQGRLQPAVRRDVFASADGVIAEVRIDHGDSCRAGDPLVVMTRSQLDFEVSRVLGEMQTARKRLAGVTAARLEAAPRTAAERDQTNQLAADEEELKALLSNLEEQQAVLRRQQDELTVRSPIDGQAITWNIREILEGRPIQKGQVLLTVADLKGPWIVEIEVPDDQIGHVLSARESNRGALDVEFMLATAPGKTYHGRIEKVSLTTDAHAQEPAHVLVTVAFDRDSVPQLRPGATVIPRIQCGRRSIGYVWFHGLMEAVQKHLWF